MDFETFAYLKRIGGRRVFALVHGIRNVKRQSAHFKRTLVNTSRTKEKVQVVGPRNNSPLASVLRRQ